MASRRSDSSEFDVVIIGAGMGGLSAAAFLAAAGRRILVIEKSERPGGLLAELPLPGYHMSTAVHNITGAFEDGPTGEGIVSAARRHLDLDGYELISIEDVYSAHFPDFTIRLPSSREAWIDAQAEQFPSERKGLEDLMDLCEQVQQEAVRLPIEVGLPALLRMPRSFPTLFKYRSARVLEVVGEFIEDPRLRRTVTTLCEPYFAVGPLEASFLGWASVMTSYTTGTHYVKSGLQKLADSFAAAIREKDGDLWLGTSADRITTTQGKVKSVSGAGWEVSTPVVVSDIDPRRLSRLLGESVFPKRYRRRLQRSQPSKALLAVYVATNLDISHVDLTYESFIFDDYSLDPLEGMLGIHIPTLIDRSLAPEGQHLVEMIRFTSGAVEDPITQAEETLEAAGQHLPDLQEHLVPLDAQSSRPYVMRRFSDPYGWAPTPSQFGMNRIPHRTPISGLFLTGQWTRPGHGIPTVIQSGADTARIVTNDRVDQPTQPL